MINSKRLIKDELGNKYGKLLVLSRGFNTKSGTATWNCICDCGNLCNNVVGSHLRNDITKSCGCLQKEKMFSRRLGDAVYKVILRNINSDCKKRHLAFNLELKDIIEISNKPCTYCKREPYELKCRYQKPNSKVAHDCLYLNGIDRIIPNLGYIKSNVTSCCKYCNRAKSDLSIDKFKELITLLYNNFINDKKN